MSHMPSPGAPADVENMEPGGRLTDVNAIVSFALTPIQKGLFAESRVASDPGLNVEQVVWELDHIPDLPRFRAAWESAIETFDALRLHFEWPASSDEPSQTVQRQVPLPFRRLDYPAVSRREQQARLESFLELDRSAGFDLLTAPLMRVSLLALGPNRAACIWTIDHCIIDGTSYPLVLQHVLQSYARVPSSLARLDDGSDKASGAPPEFREFLRWLAKHDPAPGTRHFTALLRGFDEPTPLPLQHERGLTAQGRTTHVRLRIEASAAERLEAVAEETETTANALVQLAWATLLSGYSGETDVVFGATWSGRAGTIERSVQVVGPLLSTLPTRVNLTEATSVRALLRNLRRQHLALRRFQHTSLLDIKSSSALARAPHLFQTLVLFEYDSIQSRLERADDAWRPQNVWSRSQTGFPLVLVARLDRGVLDLELEFDIGLYSTEDAKRLLADYGRILRGLCDHLDDSPLDVSMLEPEVNAALSSEEARRELSPRHPLAIERILEQAKRTPAQTAIQQIAGGELSYGELERRVLRLSDILRTHGVRAGTLVGVLLPRSIDSVVALLAVHATGAAFLPLDPRDPPQRTAYVLADSRAPLVLVNRETRGRLEGTQAAELDIDEAALAAPGTALERPSLEPSAPAYVIYTSGSTGQPKGVCVAHAALANHTAAMIALFALTPQDRVLQFATQTFDVALEELMPTLAVGATVVLRDESLASSARLFFDAVAAQRLSVINLPSAFWHQLVQAEHLTWPACLRLVVVGGERVSPYSHRKFRDADTRHLRWLNAYGPTEATITSTYYDDAEGDHGPQGIPIGRPLPGVSHFVLDERMRLVPPGAVGQLYIGGAGLAQGYLFREELTAQRFVAHPWRTGARLYATGDRVRRTAAGNYVYVDRQDHQVKVRGFRVELGEVEAQLRRHPAVSEAAVVLRRQAGEGLLVGFVAAQEGKVSEEQLREQLAATLPAHMVPSRLCVFSSLPTTPSGKVNRCALAELELSERATFAAASPGKRQRCGPLGADAAGDLEQRPRDARHEHRHELLRARWPLAARGADVFRDRAATGQDLQRRCLLQEPDRFPPGGLTSRLRTTRPSGSDAARCGLDTASAVVLCSGVDWKSRGLRASRQCAGVRRTRLRTSAPHVPGRRKASRDAV